ncbi:MAG TPA: L,D-transpeptidase [Gaiellaceae bacterium]
MRRGLLLLLLVAVAVLAGPAAARAGNDLHAVVLPAAGSLAVDSVAARSEPAPRSKRMLVLRQFRSDFRWQIVLAVGAKRGVDGRLWYRLSLPMRPNGSYGWVPARAVDLHPVRNRIVVDRARRQLTVLRGGTTLLRTTIAVGAPGMETPAGRFYVQARFVPDNSFLGVFALETSAYSRLSEWPGGGVVGIHGTSRPDLLGQAVSHGCIRVSNEAAAELRRLAPLGTPITVV